MTTERCSPERKLLQTRIIIRTDSRPSSACSEKRRVKRGRQLAVSASDRLDRWILSVASSEMWTSFPDGEGKIWFEIWSRAFTYAWLWKMTAMRLRWPKPDGV